MALQPELQSSFHGMKVLSAKADGELLNQVELPYLAEIDWELPQAGEITVDRSIFSLTAEATEAALWLMNRGEELQAEIMSEESGDYTQLNAILNQKIPWPSESWWFVNPPERSGLSWEMLSLPTLSASCLDILSKSVKAQGSGRFVSIAQGLSIYRGDPKRSSRIDWGWLACPNRPAMISVIPPVVLPQYVAMERKSRESPRIFTSEFPPAWSSLAAVGSNRLGEPWLWNRDHPFVQAVGTRDLEWFAGYDIKRASEDLLRERGRAALYLMRALQSLSPEFFYARAEDHREGFWRELWDRVAVDPAEAVTWIQQTDGTGFLWVAGPGPKGVERIPAIDPRVHRYLPDPGEEWKLTIIYRKDSTGGA